MNKLALGTAQFGQHYGIANSSGLIKKKELAEVIEFARDNNVDMLDTAVLYGKSEMLLGDAGVDDFKIISKLPSIPINCNNISLWINETVMCSLNNLGISTLYGLLLHNPEQLNKEEGELIYNSLVLLKKKGIIQKIGISLYDFEDIECLISKYSLDIIQIPFNILDQRLIATGWLDRLAEKKIEVHVRSVFLQGLLLMTNLSRPVKFNLWKNSVWDKYDNWLIKNNISSVQACLQFVLSFPKISRVIIGIDNLAHLKELLLFSQNNQFQYSKINFQTDDIMLINPSKWNNI